ncbi:MAG: ATP synthase F1 subunit delta [Phycisphaerales bacterium]|nr:ATP synthase F1 subunit delta [Phycisphaerales bacterium]
MQPVNEIGAAIAAVYAKALLGLAEGAGARDAVLEELDGLVVYAGRDVEFDRFLSSTVIDEEARRSSLEKMLRGRASDLVVDALQVLNRKGRLELLGEVAHQYRVAVEIIKQQVEVTVKTASPLTESLRAMLVGAIKTRFGQEPVLTERVESSLIGGMVAWIGDEKFDFSVSRKLRVVKDKLLARASHELHSGRSYFEGV